MSKNSFQFKQFTVNQERCAMKVGTDGTLLGAWARVYNKCPRILDIGTGTGLIALMMAQRYPEAIVVGIDIDMDAVLQAQENVAASPFASRIMINKIDITNFSDEEGYDAIVCNPPYFVDALICPGEQRTLARHTLTLNYNSLIHSARKLLKNDGCLSVIIPFDNKDNIDSAIAIEGLFVTRICQIKTTPNKLPKRLLIELKKTPAYDVDFQEVILESLPGHRSDWYREITKEFYIK